MFDNTNKMDKIIKIIGIIVMLLFPLAFIYKQFYLYTIVACLYIIAVKLIQNIHNYKETKRYRFQFFYGYLFYLIKYI